MSFQEILDELLASTGASRTTLRLDRPGENFPAVAEALASGIRPIKDDTSLDQRGAPTAQFLMKEKRPLIQNDCTSADPPPPRALLDAYGVRAQMLAPLDRGGRVIGWISVHQTGGPREWSAEDVGALERAVERVRRELEAPEPGY